MLWRGGRRPKEHFGQPAPPQTNGVGNTQDVIVIDDEDDEPLQEDQQAQDKDVYEAEEDEQDLDCPYPSMVEDLDIELEPAVEVLRMAIPSLASLSASNIPALAKTHIIVALAYSNARVVLMTIPLAPPKSSAKQEFYENEVKDVELEGDGSIVHDLAIKVVVKEDEQSSLGRTRSGSQSADLNGKLSVAAVSASFNAWDLSMTSEKITPTRKSVLPTTHSNTSGSSVSFHPSLKSTQLLVADRSGAVRLFDTSASKTQDERPSSQQSTSSMTTNDGSGRCIMSFHAPFNTPKDSPALGRRKKILDVQWVLGGRAILTVLGDGEWGVWDLSGSHQAGKNVEDFALRGFLGSLSTTEVDSGKQRKIASKLAPMTPNTRKTKAENLFSGTSRAPGAAATGGISIAACNSTRSGQVDESVILWYGSDVYSIPSTQSFWQRSTNSGDKSGSFGSLYAPGLTHVSDIDLLNENITSISQFASSKAAASGLGQMNTLRDLLISAEHRYIILETLRPAVPSSGLFQQAAEQATSRDQRMLDAGDLDLGGMDRVLNGMAGDGRTRRVGFAH